MSTKSNQQKSPKSPTSPQKMMRQKRDRRRKNLIRKAYEYSKLCDADVCLGIRIRESGQFTTFLSDSAGFWSGLPSQLEIYYPRPIQKTEKNFDTHPTTDEDDSGAALDLKGGERWEYHDYYEIASYPWHLDGHEGKVARWYSLAFSESLETLSLAPFSRVLKWLLDRIRHLAAEAKSEAFNKKIRAYNILHVYQARKPGGRAR
ncbi:hypothetical protein AAWM_08708 [Aspergillus awamori]|uniref:MADS-box domain-containing protein n=1 Tax=Aspergillus awamori TaxID=105351 RepID=A0A401L2Q8_ASPAW|nr:hypothetical protein AAWM_08708 [Aspergillus awamori]